MTSVIALFIPIIGTVGSLAVVALIVYWGLKSGDRKRQLDHELRMAAIEKGIDIPMVPVRERNPYTWPMIWIGLGLAFIIAMMATGETDWPWGFLPMFIGLAMLIARIVFRKQKKEEETKLPEITSTGGGTYDAS